MQAGVAMVLGGVAQSITPTPKNQAGTQSDNKPSYIFNGAANTTAQGNLGAGALRRNGRRVCRYFGRHGRQGNTAMAVIRGAGGGSSDSQRTLSSRRTRYARAPTPAWSTS